jgi:hypothetical protein
LEGVDFVRYKNTDAVAIKEKPSTNELVELIKSKIYCDLRQRLDIDEVNAIYGKIDDAVRCFEGEKNG